MNRTQPTAHWTRRAVLKAGSGTLVVTSLGASLFSPGCSGSAPQCFDPEMLSAGQRSLRAGQGYVDRSTAQGPHGATRACSGCQFFEASAETAACGRCQILGGPADARGHCKAWAERAPT